MRGAMRLSRSNSTHTGNEISLDKLRFSRHQSQVDPISSSSVRSRHSSGFSGNESADDDEDLILGMFTSSEEREKILSQSPYSKHDVSELVKMLAEAPTIDEQ